MRVSKQLKRQPNSASVSLEFLILLCIVYFRFLQYVPYFQVFFLSHLRQLTSSEENRF
ncbi:unnamed protein product [Brassica oleracea var. botrytis]